MISIKPLTAHQHIMSCIVNDLAPVLDINLVKNSFCFRIASYFICCHYSTIIFMALLENGNWNVIKEWKDSQTSAKMVNRCKSYLGITK